MYKLVAESVYRVLLGEVKMNATHIFFIVVGIIFIVQSARHGCALLVSFGFVIIISVIMLILLNRREKIIK